MRRLMIIFIAVAFVGGCAWNKEAYYVDHEFGKAQNDAFDQQIAYKDYRYANSKPADMPGIHAEKIMDTFQESFDRNYDSKDDQKNFSRGYIETR